MTLSDTEIREIKEKYRYYGDFESEDPNPPVDILTYVDSNGDFLLHIAARLGDVRTTQLLLKGGVDVNAIGDMGDTALHYARDSKVAEILLASGASTDIYNVFGKRPLWGKE